MNDTPFPPQLTAALDAYAVPPLPEGFTRKLLARAQTPQGDQPQMRSSKSIRRSPWARTGRFAMVIGSTGFIAATAAAAGIFGEPAYVPGISEVLIQAEIIDAPPKARPNKALPSPAISAPAAAEAASPLPVPTGSDKVKSTLQSLSRDPAFRALPPREKLRQAIAKNRELIRSGQATPQDVRRAVAEIRAETPEPMKAERRALIRREVENWRQQHKQQTPLNPAGPKNDPINNQTRPQKTPGPAQLKRDLLGQTEPSEAPQTGTLAPNPNAAAPPPDQVTTADPPTQSETEAAQKPASRKPPPVDPAAREARRQRIIETLRQRRGNQRR